jgi:N-acyl-D-aspartate/D-glutamate deacylase
MTDRGELRPGMRADVNVIDHANLKVSPPVAYDDLPARSLLVGVLGPVRRYVVHQLREARNGAVVVNSPASKCEPRFFTGRIRADAALLQMVEQSGNR